MADYEISYTANRPQAPPTGAGAIEWFIQPWAREEGEADWVEVPNTGTTVRLTTAELGRSMLCHTARRQRSRPRTQR